MTQISQMKQIIFCFTADAIMKPPADDIMKSPTDTTDSSDETDALSFTNLTN